MRALLEPALGANCFELPGHGTAQPIAADAGRGPARWFVAAGERLHEACAALAAPPVLVGYSMGGRLALYTALRFRRAVRGLIVVAADPGIKDAAVRAERLGRDEALARQLASAADQAAFTAWLQRWYATPLFGSLRHHPQFEDLLRRRLRGRPAAQAAALRGLSVGVQPVLWEALPRLPIPALFIAGADDPKYRAIADRIASLGGPWEAAVCPDAAHAVHLQQPHAVAGLIRAFVRRRTLFSTRATGTDTGA